VNESLRHRNAAGSEKDDMRSLLDLFFAVTINLALGEGEVMKKHKGCLAWGMKDGPRFEEEKFTQPSEKQPAETNGT